jgi:REP element-mobilizing transposase RayT
VKDSYNKNCISPNKEIEEDYRRWKDLPCSWIGRINIVKMAILPKAIYLHVQCNPHQNSNDILHRYRKSTLKFIWEHRRSWISQGNTEQKEQCWRHHNTWLQTIQQSQSNKNSMVLAQKQTWRSMEQNRGPRHKSTQLQSSVFLTKEPKTYIGRKTASSTNGAGKTGCLYTENWNEFPFTLY